MCFGLFKDQGCDLKRSELLYFFVQNLAGVFTTLPDEFKGTELFLFNPDDCNAKIYQMPLTKVLELVINHVV